MTRHLLLGILLGVVAIAAAAAVGPYQRAALIGAAASTATGIASLVLMQRSARARKPLPAGLLVMTVMFLVRILVVALATVAVARAGAGVIAFVIAFFVPYFLYAAVEGAYLAALPRATGPTE